MFGNGPTAVVPDYTYVQSVAENFVRAYMTVDATAESRMKELELIAPDASQHMGKASTAATQKVSLAKAHLPSFSGSKAVVDVDTWTLARKEVINNDKKEIVELPRRFMVTVILEYDGDKGYYVTGLPLVKIQETATVKPQEENSSLAAIRDEMMPVIKSVIPGVISGDIASIANFLTKDTSINAYKGEFQLVKIGEVFVKQSDRNKYIVDVNVQVNDPAIEGTMDVRINMIFVQKDGKFYVQQVS